MSVSDDGARRKLSERELEVADLYANGDTYKAIARALDIAPATVRKHLNAIYQKLEVSNKIELLQRLDHDGSLVPPPAAPSSPVIASPIAAMPAWAERRALAVVAVEIEPGGSDAEEQHAGVQAFQHLTEEVLERLSGMMLARMDGLIIGHFGWPEAHDDDAERAVRAGIEILDGTRALAAGRHLQLHARAGAAFGTVVADPSAPSEVTGEALRLARKLASSGRNGRLVVDTNTAELVRHIFELEPAPDGAPASIARFLVGPAIDQPTRFDARAAGMMAAFVGREAELALLGDRWRLAQDGEGQIVLIRGEPGIGKSRLVREFMERSEIADQAEVVQALPFHKHTPLHPFAGHLGKLTETPTAAADHAEAGGLLRDLVDGVDQNDVGTWRSRERRAQALRLYARLLLSPASTGVRLLVIEDIHWLDPSSFELLRCLLAIHAGLSAMVLMTARDRALEPFERVASMTDVTLGPLSAPDGRRLVASLTGTGPGMESHAAIVERSGGIPLFLEELAQSIADRPQLVGGDVAGVGFRPVPLTLQQTIAVRLEALGPARRAAQAAAVVGRRFDHALLRALMGTTHTQHNADWQRLATSTLFRQMDTGSKLALHFKHALVRDAAYGSLLPSERKELHRRLCQLYRKAPFRAHDSLIAQNAELAGEWEVAFEHFYRAGKDARARWALTEAIAHLERAISTFDQAATQTNKGSSSRSIIETTLLLCECLYFTGTFQRSFDTLNSLRDEIAKLRDRQLRGRAWFWLARLASRLGDRHELTQDAARSAIADSLAVKDVLTTGNTFSVLAVENFFLGKPDESVAAGRRAIDFLAKLPTSEVLGFAHHYIAIAHVLAGRFDRAITACAEVIHIGDALEHPRLICYGHSIRGWARGYLGASAEAELELRQAIDAGPDHASRVFGSGYLGQVLVEAGRYEEAVPLLAMAAEECRGFPSPQYASLFDALLAKALAESGDAAAGSAAGERAVVGASACAFSFAHALALRHLAQIDTGSAALSRFMRAVELFAESASHFEHARTLLALAAFADREGLKDVDADQCRCRGANLLRQLGIRAVSFET